MTKSRHFWRPLLLTYWLALSLALIGLGPKVFAAPELYSIDLVKVADNVYSAIGDTNAPTYENGGHNNNLSFVIGSEAVLVFNGGDSFLLAKAFHEAIKKITKVPVRWLVNENAQGHSMLGNSYWSEQGVTIVAQRAAIEEIKREGRAVLARMLARNKDKGVGTFIGIPTEVIDEKKLISLGDTEVEIINFGPAHAPGDISLWIPAQALLIAGDIAFHQRLVAVFPQTDSAGWIASFDKMAALAPRIIIPGHGEPTTLDVITRWTRGYLSFLRAEVAKILEADGELEEAYKIDQSAYAHLNAFEELAAKNAGRVFQQMEGDFF